MKALLKLVALAALVAVALVGCSGNMTKEDGTQSSFSEVSYKLKDGRTVLCIVGYNRFSCDWEAAK